MDLDGKSLAIIIWDVAEPGDVAYAHAGLLRRVGSDYQFFRRDGEKSFKFESDWLVRIQTVPEDLKEILFDADLMLSLTVGPLPDDVDPSELVDTGLRIPESE